MRRGHLRHIDINQKTASSCIPLNTSQRRSSIPLNSPQGTLLLHVMREVVTRGERGIGPPSLSNRLRGGGENPPIGRWRQRGMGDPLLDDGSVGRGGNGLPSLSNSPSQGSTDRADSYSLYPSGTNDNDLEMANLPTDMELEQADTQRNSSRSPSPLPQLTPCELLKYNKAQLTKMETFRRCKQACVDALMMMPDHYPEEPFYVRALTELQDIEETMALAITPTLNTPTKKKTARKILDITDNEELNLSPNKFALPQGARLNNFENSGPVANGNNPLPSREVTINNGSNNSASQNVPQNQFPPPILLLFEKNYKAQMAAITKEFPKIRSRLTGEFLKLYTDSAEERRTVVQLLKRLKFQFYTMKSKAERPIKVVIKGLPRNTNPEELLGYTPERVNQLIGRKTKRPLPIFLITLHRNLDNLKIFDLKTLSYLSIRVEGYDGKGVTQCYTCNNFNHSSENCHLNPKCLKCGENHITRDCPIKQKLETPYCINCQIYGHMTNYKGCPSFPKPPKGAAKNNINSYTNIYNSLVRPNISYAQATSGIVNTKNTPQMATHGPGSSAQTKAKKPTPPPK
ncbi:nucleic-acid-binding protein from transposon X-element [Trichonephila clavipes]|nr:nucleic-acid-binding protein from transposon X-element [Trichonephila clavipes]